jgi:hypothetical protein
MKIIVLTAMLTTGAMAYGQIAPTLTEHKVAVCLEGYVDSRLPLPGARTLASKMFAEIGVVIDWRHSCGRDGILIRLRMDTPATLKPGALAYALPYEGRHIEIFYDRISHGKGPMIISIVLAHVFVHEITHILEGVARHSDRGIMKARWDSADLFCMRRKPLAFAPEDIELIRLGLAARTRVPILAMKAAPTVAGQ